MAPILEISRPWDLAQTGWMVVFAPDIEPRVKASLGELLELRRSQAGRSHSNYYRELTYSGETTFDFVKKHGGKPGMLADPDYFPYYVLLVGSPDSMPYRFQAELDVNNAVGRICFEKAQDYANYARSVVQAECWEQPLSRRVVFFAPEHMNDPASQRVTQALVHPLAKSVLDQETPWESHKFCGAMAHKEKLHRLLGGKETPALLFAACHGLGLDDEDERQQSCQGALICQDWPGPDSMEGVGEDQWFAASDIPDSASLGGLIAFLYASYSIGMPERPAFDQQGLVRRKPIKPSSLVARLPQRLLGRQDGALGVIGHVGRAWLPGPSGTLNEGVGAFLYGVRRLLQGHTVGWAMEYLNQSYASLAAALLNIKDDRSFEEVDQAMFARLWLARNDARNIMLFGDPAVRLPGVSEPSRRAKG